MDLDFCREVRLAELRQVEQILRDHLPHGASVLELGAGSGWQAQEMARLGYQVTAIDLAESNYVESRVWPVVDYDGEHFPFADASFDAVYSSNALEHIANYPQVDAEIARVLKPGGVAVHVVPSGTWRLWTIFSQYPALLKMVCTWGGRKSKECQSEDGIRRDSRFSRRDDKSCGGLIFKALVPRRHGVHGNALTEIFSFSVIRWRRLFEGSSWHILRLQPNRLFYTGRLVFGKRLPLAQRRFLSMLLGSSCHMFVLSRDRCSNLKGQN